MKENFLLQLFEIKLSHILTMASLMVCIFVVQIFSLQWFHCTEKGFSKMPLCLMAPEIAGMGPVPRCSSRLDQTFSLL